MPRRERVIIGLEHNGINDLFTAAENATQSGFNFILVPLVHPRFRREFTSGKAVNRPGPFTRSDLIFNSNEWSTVVVGKISPWIDLDSPVLALQQNSEKVLEQEINYAYHLGIRSVLLSIHHGNCINLGRFLYNKVAASILPATPSVWVHVPMKAPDDERNLYINTPSQNPAEPVEIDYKCDTWEWWNVLRTVTNHDKRIALALELSAELNELEIERWYGEPIQALIIPTSIYLTNKKGFPVLSRAHQNLIRRMFRLDVHIVVKGINRHTDIRLYQQYIDHLFKTQEPPDFLTNYAIGFEDYLQIPLQPLMDNLETHTYETFEKDPVKYKEYERALYQALLDIVPEEEKDTKTVVIMVVGAGRGPLVRASLAAAQQALRTVKVYAVEKNPNAVVTLQSQQDEMWGDKVTVVSCDMRDWDAPEKGDILVSELLGSFGDNELSPECLDGAEKFLKDGGISIPCSYTSYLAPISSPKLHSEVAGLHSDTCYKESKIPWFQSWFEMPYVVRIHNRSDLASPLPVFTFIHPNPEQPPNNSRYVKLAYKMPYNCIVHGFAGFFDCVLYKDIKLSIHPDTHTDGLFSWFPIFFPIKDPVYVHADEDVEIHFWRCISKRDVWYEWLITKPILGTVHNPNGRAYKIGL